MTKSKMAYTRKRVRAPSVPLLSGESVLLEEQRPSKKRLKAEKDDESSAHQHSQLVSHERLSSDDDLNLPNQEAEEREYDETRMVEAEKGNYTSDETKYEKYDEPQCYQLRSSTILCQFTLLKETPEAFLAEMKVKESEDLDFYLANKTVEHVQLDKRKLLIEWLMEVCQVYCLKPTTVQMAVTLFDAYTSISEIPLSQWQLVASATVMLAAKFNEVDDIQSHLPRVAELLYSSCNQYTSEDFYAMEHSVLQAMDWGVNILSPAHFVEFYAFLGLFRAGECLRDDVISAVDTVHRLASLVDKRALFFCEVFLRSYPATRFRPSVLGAACVAAARQYVGIQPLWSPYLTATTTLGLDDVQECLGCIHAAFEEMSTVGTAEGSGSQESGPTEMEISPSA